MQPLMDYAKNLQGGKILDAATGYGCFVKILAKAFKDYEEIIGIDLDPKRLEKIEEESKLEDVSFKPMSLDNLEFEDNYFDTVAIRFSVHHLTNIDHALSEMKRVLKPGGLFLICEMYRDNLNQKQQNSANLHHWWAEVDKLRKVPHYHTLLRQELISHFEFLRLKSTEYKDYTLPVEDNGNKDEDIAELDEIFERYTGIIREYPGHEDLIEQGRKFLSAAKAVGMEEPPILFMFGRK